LKVVITPGQQHEQTVFEELLEGPTLHRREPGRPRRRPQAVVGDKGYSSQRIRRELRRKGIRAVIPRKVNEHRTGPFDRAVYRERNMVERCINRLKQCRRIATRSEKLAQNFPAMVTLGCILQWL
jgi:transposase